MNSAYQPFNLPAISAWHPGALFIFALLLFAFILKMSQVFKLEFFPQVSYGSNLSSSVYSVVLMFVIHA